MNESVTMTCEQALALLAALIDVELSDDERTAVERHLETCRSCYSRAEFERRLKQQLAALGRRDVALGFEDRIRTLIARYGA